MTRRARTQPRKIPRQRRARATVDAIVEAATRILRSEGYEQTNVNRVAERAGVSVGSLYQYFPTKDALVAEVAKRLAARMSAVLEDGLPALAEAPLEDAVRGIVKRAIAAHSVDPTLRRVIVSEVPHGPAFMATRELDEAIEAMVAGYLEHQRDRIRVPDVRRAARILVWGVEGIVVRYATERPLDLASGELEEDLAALVFQFLGASPIRAPGAP